MAEVILGRLGLEAEDAFHTVHNYIDTDEMILRKGAIAQGHGDGSSVRRRTAGTAPISLLKTEPKLLVRSEEKTPLRAASFSGFLRKNS